MLINKLMEEIQNVSNDYNDSHGMLSESLEVKFDQPIIESFDQSVFESISEETILNTTLSEELINSIVDVCGSLAEVYEVLENSKQ